MKLENCSQLDCENIPCIIIYWSGKTPPPIYCLEHASQAKRILDHMTPVHMESYSPKLIE